MNKRVIALLLALTLTLGGARLARGEEEAPVEPTPEQSAPAPEIESEPEPEPDSEPEPDPEPELESEPEPEPDPESEPAGDAEDGGEDLEGDVAEGDISEESASNGDASEGEVPPAPDSEENPDEDREEEEPSEAEHSKGDPSGDDATEGEPVENEPAEDDATEDEPAEDEPAVDESTKDEPAEDESTEDGSEEQPEDEGSEGEIEANLTVEIDGLTVTQDGAWCVPAGTATLHFRWNGIEGANEFAWSVAESGESGSVTDCALDLNVADYAPGTYTLNVRAALSGGSEEGSARFEIEGAGEEPEPDGPASELAVVAEGAALLENGTWQFPESTDTLRFSWMGIEGVDAYEWQVADAAGNVVAAGSQSEATLELSARDYASERFTLTVWAQAGEVSAQACLGFVLAQRQNSGRFPGGRPSGFGGFGSFRSSPGGRPSGGAASGGDATQEEQGFRITPGVALTDSHASGTGDMSNYGAANLSLAEEPVTWLALSGSEPDIRRTDGESFTAALEADALTLSCNDAAAVWVVNPLALAALRQSGIVALNLDFGAESVALPTDLEFAGSVYAAYRARGYVSKDFELRVALTGVTAVVDGETYALNDAHELIQL